MAQTPPEQTTNGHAATAAPARRRTTPRVGQKSVVAAEATPPAPDPNPTDRPADSPDLDEETGQETPEPVGTDLPRAGDRVAVDAAWLAWVQRELTQPVDCEAHHLEIGIPDPELATGDHENPGTGDPFDAELLLAGPAPSGQEIALWIRLTPTVIGDLQTRLDEVLTAQRHALGLQNPTDTADLGNPDPEDTKPSGSRARRIADPLGVRSMVQTSTTRAQIIIVTAVVALVLLAVILRIAS